MNTSQLAERLKSMKLEKAGIIEGVAVTRIAANLYMVGTAKRHQAKGISLAVWEIIQHPDRKEDD